ncbi:hypothetical protein GC093_17035 [Paenibacillus sp. LMG 31456]|uniref:Uncharacterized protein n=1 Tax=Paenibacillus foliorum TaxID=2654974 RepID=A0A972K2G7_9BACL|nr:hypothetical protein [Paenibacillus foliorum]NOU94913.1 hypothetical protein [Paenibacillus foliorum]
MVTKNEMKHADTMIILKPFIDIYNQHFKTAFEPIARILDSGSTGADVEDINKKDLTEKLIVEHKRLPIFIYPEEKKLHYVREKFLNMVGKWDKYLINPVGFKFPAYVR